MLRRPRTEDELKRAHALRLAGFSYDEIDKVFCRPAGSSERRLGHVRSGRVLEILSAERDALAAGLSGISSASRRQVTRP